MLYVSAENLPNEADKYPGRIDLAAEVVSDGEVARRRDYVEKRDDYARAGVREYWIVDPVRRAITVLELQDAGYEERGVFGDGEFASGVLLPDLAVDVSLLFAAVKKESL